MDKIKQIEPGQDQLAPLSEVCRYENPYLKVIEQRRLNKAGSPFACFVKHEADVVVCVVVDKSGFFVLVEEYRPGPGRMLFEIPGGNVDEGEDVSAAVVREVREETGYTGRLVYLRQTYMSAYSTSRKHIFIMLDAEPGPCLPGDINEDVRVVLFTAEEFRQNAFCGDLTDLDAALSAIYYLDSRV